MIVVVMIKNILLEILIKWKLWGLIFFLHFYMTIMFSRTWSYQFKIIKIFFIHYLKLTPCLF